MAYQAIDDSVIFSTTNKDDFGNDSHHKVDGDVLPEVVQGVTVQEKSSGLHVSPDQVNRFI